MENKDFYIGMPVIFEGKKTRIEFCGMDKGHFKILHTECLKMYPNKDGWRYAYDYKLDNETYEIF